MVAVVSVAEGSLGKSWSLKSSLGKSVFNNVKPRTTTYSPKLTQVSWIRPGLYCPNS